MILVAALLFAAPVSFHAQAPQGAYHIVKQTLLGGMGNWDYVTVDPDNHRIYIPRGTHVMVLDEASHKVIADIPGMKGIHGLAVATGVGRGYVTGNDPKGVIYVVDLKTNTIATTIPTGEDDCDGIMYDPGTKRIYVNNGDSKTTTVIDPATNKVVGTIHLPGPVEAAASDGKGTLYVNLVDDGKIAVVDAKTMMVKTTYPVAPCQRGYGAAIDSAHGRLFLACQGAKPIGVVMDTATGKVVASLPIGGGSDGAAFDPATGDVFFTCRDGGNGMGVVNIFHEDSPDKYTKVADVNWMYGARTVGLDPKTHHVFSIGAVKNDPVPPTEKNPNPRPRPDLTTFSVVEVGK